MSNKDDAGLIGMLADEFEAKGITSASVKGGRVFLFSRKFLEDMLGKHPEQNEFHILIQDRVFAN